MRSTSLTGVGSGDQVAGHQITGGRDVGIAPLCGLALDHEAHLGTNRKRHLEEPIPVHGPLPDRHLASPPPGRPGGVGILDVGLLDVGGEPTHGHDRVAHPVEDDVGRVEVHTEGGMVELHKNIVECLGPFLAGLESRLDAVGGEEIRDRGEPVEHDGPRRIVAVLRQEAAVKRDQADPLPSREPGHRLRLLQVGRPCPVGPHAARSPNRLQRRIILPRHGHHPAQHADPARPQPVEGPPPDRGLGHQRPQRQLHRLDFKPFQRLHKP